MGGAVLKSFLGSRSLAGRAACVMLVIGCSGRSVRSSDERGETGGTDISGGGTQATGGTPGGGMASGGAAGVAEAGAGGSSGAGAVGGGGISGAGGVSGVGGAGEGGRRSVSLVELERVGGLGFCIEAGMLVTARVEPDAAGALSLSGTVHIGWEDPPTCPSAACEIREPIGPTALSEANRDELERMLAQLPLVPCEGAVSPVCDPCLGTRVTVDGAQHLSMACVSGCDAPAMVVWAIGEFLDRLAL